MSSYQPTISIIIPVLNEANYIKKVLLAISKNAGSNRTNARDYGATVINSKKGRAAQMNVGAAKATGEILYFLHVDSLPPKHFDLAIFKALEESHEVGCFEMRFNSDSAFLKFFAWCTKINHQICRGGDQSLFITNKLFHENNGFNENYIIYEDNEFIGRMYKLKSFKIISAAVTTSARRYEERGMVQLQWHFAMIHLKHYLGAKPQELHQYYLKHIAI